MKIPDIGDVMNKFEVLGIVGEGEIAIFIPLYAVKCLLLKYIEGLRTDPPGIAD